MLSCARHHSLSAYGMLYCNMTATHNTSIYLTKAKINYQYLWCVISAKIANYI